MNSTNAERIIERLLAYWPGSVDDAEALAWADVLTSPEHAITESEAVTFLRRRSHDGAVRRPRPGELMAFVQAERRWQRLHDDSRALTAPRSGACDAERTGRWIRACRRIAAGERLEDAKAAEGIA